MAILWSLATHFVAKGNTRVTAVNTDGQVFVDTVVSLLFWNQWFMYNLDFRAPVIYGISRREFLIRFKEQRTTRTGPSFS